MGPFAQQIVSLESRSVPQPNVNSTIPIARIYDTGAISSDDYVYNPINADSDMQGAFFNGLFNLGTPFDFTCPTGNCTWPEFSSLALCSNCEDVTGQTAREEIGGENKSAPTTLLKTPGGVSIQLNDRGSSKGYYDLLAGNTSGLYTWSTLLLATIAVAQAQGEAIGFSFEPQYDEYVRDSLSYTVTECNITWCAKRYRDVSVVNGTLENFSMEDVPLIQRGRISLVNLTLSESKEDNVDATPLAPWKNTTFFVMYQDNASTRQFLLKALTFNTISYSEEQDYVFNTGRALYKQNITEVISNITTSMTNRIRRGRNSTVANGVVLQPGTIVVVQWSWSIVPISLVVLGFAFLAAVVCVNSSQGAPLWKSGLVPFLFHGFEDGWREQQGARITKIERRDEVTDEAARMCVRLRPNQDDHTHFAIL
ncbi:hypothetical protein GTA08_BOTSDO09510 [Botryosphaeria dothidea]|uniref:Uncharacterized protein n=1 Tax=Botryosphaeria dothidea TaxID=55169 RepID=A0A8H4IKF6_9PEZI|nr:hypothetical protein GTA08_BOTSDO09510 [Botryosphaeria dothidea]